MVEDDQAVMLFASLVLEKQGYRILQAASAPEALAIAAVYDARIDLLLADVAMRFLGGLALARRLRKERPHLRVLLMSDYPDTAMIDLNGAHAPGTSLLSKPFSATELVHKAREVLDEPKDAG